MVADLLTLLTIRQIENYRNHVKKKAHFLFCRFAPLAGGVY